tara:strand:+ start:66 stop:773 length:708 start_codon:yes stop_codon:yes gene_type:complete
MMHARDELRTRSQETSPEWRTLAGGLRACWPTDPDAGGTWVGAREDGLVLGILNLKLSDDELDPEMPIPTRSRGLVIPALMDASSFTDAIDSLQAMDLMGMKPFRLVMTGIEDGECRFAAARFDGMKLTMPSPCGLIKVPECWASSGLGDELVQCRLPIFEEMVGENPTPENQRAFHWFQWEEEMAYSPMMSRKDARTSSVTTIVVEPGKEPTVLYDPIAIGDAVCDPVGAGMLR